MRLLEFLEDLLSLGFVRVGPERLELAAHFLEESGHAVRGEAHRDGLREERQEAALVDRVVEELRLELWDRVNVSARPPPQCSRGLTLFSPTLNCLLTAAYRIAIVKAFLATLAASATIAVRPWRSAPYVSCARGGSRTSPSRVT